MKKKMSWTKMLLKFDRRIWPVASTPHVSQATDSINQEIDHDDAAGP
jgi:hypothetical protein